MKKTILFLLLLSAVNFYGQHRVNDRIQHLTKRGITFIPFKPLKPKAGYSDAEKIDKVVANASFAMLDKAVVKQIADTRPDAISLDIPYQNQTLTVLLYRTSIFANGFHIDTDRKRNMAYQEGAYYRGIIENDSNSLVSFSFFNNEMNGIISSASLQNLVVGKLRTLGNRTDYIVYSDANLAIPSHFGCATVEPPKENRIENAARGIQDEKCVTIYFELDNALYQQNDSSEILTANWLTSLFNNIQTLYDNDGISISLKSFFIWTTPDPYSGGDSSDYLNQFTQTYMQQDFDGDLGQLLGIDAGNLGGVAWLEGFCSAGNVSYVDVDLAFQNVPLFSFNVQATTHEFGHQMGSEHTHSCAWNGNNTPIDGCGQVIGFPDPGSTCAFGPLPSAGNGTLMSYCYLIPAIGVNFANGFGSQPSARIHNYLASSGCLGTACDGNCHNTITSFSINSITETSATIGWESTGTGPWETSFREFNTGVDNWQPTAANILTMEGLNPNTYYVLAVRPVCDDGISLGKETIFATGADWCVGQPFFDVGANHWYTNETEITRTISPSEQGKRIKVSFSMFSLEEGFDFLNIYNGPNTDAPLIAHLSGTDNPGDFISTAADGSLTFEFTADEIITQDGWDAWVSCEAALSLNENVGIAGLSCYPNPTNGWVDITAASVMNEITVCDVTGKLLLIQAANTMEATIDISSFSAGVYFFKVISGTKQSIFKVVRQN